MVERGGTLRALSCVLGLICIANLLGSHCSLVPMVAAAKNDVRAIERWTQIASDIATRAIGIRFPATPESLVAFVPPADGKRLARTTRCTFSTQQPARNKLNRQPCFLSASASSSNKSSDKDKKKHQEDSTAPQDASDLASSTKNPEDILDEDRRTNLFQFLLRDLQVEGVPLLSVDADQVDTLQAAMWTTMAELLTGWRTHKGKQKEKVCLIFEDIPIDALRSFVSDFQILQTQERLMRHLPELSWFHLETVGRGVGPAIVVTIEPMTKEGRDKDVGYHLSEDFFASDENQPKLDDAKIIAAMKMFVDRVACGMEVCPHFNFDLEVQASQTNYRVCSFSDVCHVLSAFWNGICELQTTPTDKLSAIMLMLPAITEMKTIKDFEGRFVTGPDQQHSRFAAVAELISRSLCLYRGNDVFDLLHFHPTYERDLIHPKDRPAFGHLPPTSWLQPIVDKYYDLKGFDESERRQMSHEDLQLAEYQRRSPVTAVLIKRAAMVEEQASKEPDAGMLELAVEGETVMASSVPYYARNILNLAKTGKEELQSDLNEEMTIAKGK